MAYSKLFASLAMLMAIQPMFSNGDNISPSLSPFFDNICDEVNCGRGTCQVAPGRPFNFVCQCDAGWNRTLADHNDYNENLHQFLPCIVPNCTLDYSCMPAPPPAPPISYNLSFFDPCSWIYCGQGTCTKNHTYTHTCQCNPGYYNLQNITAFPCFSECAIGSECSRIGVRISNSSSSSSSPDGRSRGRTDGGSGSQATSFLPGKFHWATIILMSVATAMLN